MDNPTISLRSLLRSAGFSTAKWITSPDSGQNVAVSWVSLRLESTQPGDALLVAVNDLSKAMLGKARKVGVAAVLISGDLDTPAGFAESDIPVVTLPASPDLEATHRLLLTSLINQSGQQSGWGGGIHHKFDRMVAEGEDLQGLARAMTDISGRGVLVQDKRLRILASNPSTDLLDVWDELLSDLTDVNRLPETLQDRKEAGRGNQFLTQNLPGGLARLVTPIIVGDVARGYLSLIGLDGDLDTMDRTVAEQGALACAVQMSRSKAIRETEKRLRGDLLTALLQGDLSPRDAQLWAEAMGVDLAKGHTALRFSWDTDSSSSLRRLETLVNGEVPRLGVSVIVDTMASEVICFCQVDPDTGEPKPAITLGEKVIARGLEEDPNSSARCGIGSPTHELASWHTSFRQAGQALELANRLKEYKPLYFPDLSVYRLLMQLENSQELQEFETEILGKLTAYESGDELLRTLQAYFNHNGNLSQTADALFIHRNSLVYRMDRIAAITGLDLDNPETRLAIQLALHIYRMAD